MAFARSAGGLVATPHEMTVPSERKPTLKIPPAATPIMFVADEGTSHWPWVFAPHAITFWPCTWLLTNVAIIDNRSSARLVFNLLAFPWSGFVVPWVIFYNMTEKGSSFFTEYWPNEVTPNRIFVLDQKSPTCSNIRTTQQL